MAKGKRKGSESESPVLTLKLDSKTPEPVEIAAGSTDAASSSWDVAFQTPCSITGLGAGLSGGTLGYVFGFGGYWMKNRLKGTLKASLAEGWGSAKTFAIMGGLYAAVTCFAKRIRQKEDGWNGAAAGCATGLALGWGGGPSGALQSCALFGIFSYFIDGMGAGTAQAAPGPRTGLAGAAPARLLADSGAGASGSWGSQGGDSPGSGRGQEGAAWPAGAAGWEGSQQWLPQWLEGAWQQLGQHAQHGGQAGQGMEGVRRLLSPAMPLLVALAPCQFDGGQGEAVAGCRVVRRRCR